MANQTRNDFQPVMIPNLAPTDGACSIQIAGSVVRLSPCRCSLISRLKRLVDTCVNTHSTTAWLGMLVGIEHELRMARIYGQCCFKRLSWR
jgi:hypothetical protein